ncbi:hypothetical protein [Holospora curviuscula]|uniref:DNA polymerase III subunit delta n=1 Tax=Holospora curviuscula TaxID=1082868 RepID=A0A2S5R8G6_9PROT|nr:hypothetical protein [Holospora curviuscula]PPE03472.1 DNA polymerase III subunit delta' [Holospora curviuscula]
MEQYASTIKKIYNNLGENPKFLGFLLGYEDVVKQFQRALEGGRLPHSWLFLGEDGLGKTTLCYALACLALGYEGSLKWEDAHRLSQNIVYRRVISRAHPELHVLSLPITLDQIRSIKKRLLQTSVSDSWKVIILPRLDLLRHDCVNALLKIVEDPPEKSLFLFTAVHSAFPATLLSRCCVYPLRPWSKEVFFPRLKIVLNRLEICTDNITVESNEFPQKFQDWIYAFTRGSLGKAVRILSSGKVDLIQRAWDFLNVSFHEGPCPLPFELAHHLYQNIDLFQEVVFLWAFDKLSQYFHQRKQCLLLDQLLRSIQIWFQQAKDFHMDPVFLVQKIISNVALIPQKSVFNTSIVA